MAETNVLPIARMIRTRNRTRTGKRTSTPAKKAAAYFAFGPSLQEQVERRQRGEWIGPGGERHSHEAIMEWVTDQARRHEYTFQAMLSVPEGRMTAVDYAQAIEQGGHIADWRLVVHDDTAHSHAHVLFFRDKRLEKEHFIRWHNRVRQELAALEQKRLAGQAIEPEQAAEQMEPVRDGGLEL